MQPWTREREGSLESRCRRSCPVLGRVELVGTKRDERARARTNLSSRGEVGTSNTNTRSPGYIANPIGVTLKYRLHGIRRPSLGILPARLESSAPFLLRAPKPREKDSLPSPQPNVSIASSRSEPLNLSQSLLALLLLTLERGEGSNSDGWGPGDGSDAQRVGGEKRGIPSAVVCLDPAQARDQHKEREQGEAKQRTVEGEDGDFAVRRSASEDGAELMWCPCDSIDCAV